jgi:hypothetical protein
MIDKKNLIKKRIRKKILIKIIKIKVGIKIKL